MKRAEPFYLGREWKALRQQALHRDGYRCVICNTDVSAPGKARVDHIKPRKTHPHLALVLSNLRTLCALHDAQGHREKQGNGTHRIERFVARGADIDGWPVGR